MKYTTTLIAVLMLVNATAQVCETEYNSPAVTKLQYSRIALDSPKDSKDFIDGLKGFFKISKSYYTFDLVPKAYMQEFSSFVSFSPVRKEFFEQNKNWQVEYSFEVPRNENAFHGFLIDNGNKKTGLGISKNRKYFVTSEQQDFMDAVNNRGSSILEDWPEEIPSNNVMKLTLRKCGNEFLFYCNEYLLYSEEVNSSDAMPMLFFNGKMYVNIRSVVTGKLTINETVAATTAKVIPGKIVKSELEDNIPLTGIKHVNRYALIIGNEDYTSFQKGTNTEINVDYAEKDARVFRQYCINVLGVPDKHAELLINATAAQINQKLSWLSNMASIEGGNAELIFYYSGHGLPDQDTKEPYIIPVDVNGQDLSFAIKLSSVYRQLNKNPAARVTYFIDACFSGASRGAPLLAEKGVKIPPKDETLSGNSVMFSSSSGVESSMVYREKGHGYFTYFLLKRLQETKGDLTYSQLWDYLLQNVKKETALSGKQQTPQVSYSTSISGAWGAWKVR